MPAAPVMPTVRRLRTCCPWKLCLLAGVLCLPLAAQSQGPVPRGPMLLQPEFDPAFSPTGPQPHRTAPRPTGPFPGTTAQPRTPQSFPQPQSNWTPGTRASSPLSPAAPQLQLRQYGPEPPRMFPRQTRQPVPDRPHDYWIISTRRCLQLGGYQTQRQCLEYFHRGAHSTPQTPHGLQLRREDEFLASVNPDVPVCIIVHGSLIGWQDLLDESSATYRWLRQAAPDQPLQVVFFTWPSDRPLSALAPLDMTILGEQSSFNSLYLGHVLGKLPPATRVSLIGHSHGARIVTSTLHLLAGGEIHGQRLPPPPQGYPRVRVVLAAAAIDHHWLQPGERYGRALEPLEGLLNLRNSQDFALTLYPLRRPFGVESLGRRGFRTQDRTAFAPFLKKIRELEIAPLLGPGHTWPHYYGNPQIAQAVTPYVYYTNDSARRAQPETVYKPEQVAPVERPVNQPIPARPKFAVPSAVRIPGSS